MELLNYKLLMNDIINCNNIAKIDKFEIVKPRHSSVYGLESSEGSTQGLLMAKTFALSNHSAEDLKALLNGEAFLEFWFLGINHNVPTTNRKMYPEDIFVRGMQVGFMNMLNNGGVPGEMEHPLIQMTSDNPELCKFNIQMRLTNFDRDKESHTIIGHKIVDGCSWFKIRTSTKNPIIVRDIIEGKRPAFSIRTVGEFAPPDSNGIIMAKNITVVTVDYVRNPALADAHLNAGDMLQLHNPILGKKIDVSLVESRMGVESNTILQQYINSDDVVYFDNVNNLPCMYVVKKDIVNGNFDSEFDKIKKNLF